MPAETTTWWDHYLELLREGEAKGLKFQALGEYIQRRLTPAELRDVLAHHYRAHDKNQPTGGNTSNE